MEHNDMSVKELIAEIKSNDAKQRSDAWYAAGPVGADGIAPLAAVMAEMDAVEIEVARAAKNAMWTIVRYASRPAAYIFSTSGGRTPDATNCKARFFASANRWSLFMAIISVPAR